MPNKKNKDCFIIMPIADADGYPDGHFGHVYENIIKPACSMAQYKPLRADEVKETNLIHLDILKKLIEAPMAICDLSNRNPNVLFELGIRQAFDKPVVLIQEKGTPKIFDIGPLRYLEYTREMKYHDVLDIQKSLKESLLATAKAESDSSNINSIVKLLALNSPAQIPTLETNKDDLEFQFLKSEMREIKNMLEGQTSKLITRKVNHDIAELEDISTELNSYFDLDSIPVDVAHSELRYLQTRLKQIMMTTRSRPANENAERLFLKVNDLLNSVKFSP